MFDNIGSGWLIAGGATIATLLATGWSYVQTLFQQIYSRVIATITVSGYEAEAIRLYLKTEFKASQLGPRAYLGWMLYVQPQRRVQLVSMEVTHPGGRLYWKGWRALWVGKSKQSSDDGDAGVTSRDWDMETIMLSYPRGMFQADQLVSAATELYNEQVLKKEMAGGRRHYVRHLYGSAGKDGGEMGSSLVKRPTSYTDFHGCLHHRLLDLSFTELGPPIPKPGEAFNNLALCDEAGSLIEEARHWKASEEWYKSRGIPWRRGWLLYGPPGTGKTALARAVAEDLDLPVYAYDLASMHNSELQAHWTGMLSQVPCMALIEDIDAVFNKRQNVTSRDKQALTFDCLLNCLDGVERSDGLLVIISTNRMERIDSALGIDNGDGCSTRPGRIDRVVELNKLNEAGRRKIASRILEEWPQHWETVIDEGTGDTGAQFQERCTSFALQLRYEEFDDELSHKFAKSAVRQA